MFYHGGGPLLDLERHLDEVFEKLIYRRWAVPNPAGWRPQLDVHETGDAYLIEFDLPGIPPNQVEIRVAETSLSISGTRPATSLAGVLVSRTERECGSFRRSLTLPRAVNPDHVVAEYRHGTYQVRLVKQQPAAQAAQGRPEAETGRLIRITIS